MCPDPEAPSLSQNTPVDSQTYMAPTWPQGICAGSFSWKTRTFIPLTTKYSAVPSWREKKWKDKPVSGDDHPPIRLCIYVILCILLYIYININTWSNFWPWNMWSRLMTILCPISNGIAAWDCMFAFLVVTVPLNLLCTESYLRRYCM